MSFVKEWASDHGLTYMCSIGDPRLKADYAEFKKTGKKPKKSGRASKYQTKEEARLANIAKTAERKRAKKMIQMGAPERLSGGMLPLQKELEARVSRPIDPVGKTESLEDAILRHLIERTYISKIPTRNAEGKAVVTMAEYIETKKVLMDFLKKDPRYKLSPETQNALDQKKTDALQYFGLGLDGEGIFDRGNQMPPSARDYLKKNGDQTITSMRIERIPLGGLQKSLTAIVYVRELLTKFKKPENIPQDDLFHLQMVLTLSNGRRVMWGKEEVIKLSETIYKGDRMESRDLGKTNIKLQDFVDKTAKTMGAKFAPYNAFDNNCQDFIMASLKSNGLGTQADYDFVKQDTKDLFKGRQWLIDMMKGATDLASAFNVLIEGKGAHK